ncbi:hypothetical protein SAMN05421640_3689 [Ekhidna lutea]|uniref:SMODS and SLOG-associating 2TM effector domain-containing protein n=1 Tax=Ekhidna lutea TaxID=447679 RepID=A0A239M700_EKHLU|nr:hypothetical protein [Ekhidna lutea]SNT38506.1 hypothetical protein SAMN05421640_3689 [Ekhidna lutea]
MELDKKLLESEYFHLQSEIENYDNKSLTIKAWSVSVAGFIAGSSAFTENKLVILFAALVSLMFWVIDASWKSFQYSHYIRIGKIESYMRGELKELANFQITKSWIKSHKKGGTFRFFKILFFLHVILPHGVMFVLLSALYFYLIN